MRTVRELAEIAGVTVRALHHYDEIGLLKPSGRSKSGYRLYSQRDLLRLQEILGWRQLGFSLREVKELLDVPDNDRAAALRRQRSLARDRLAQATALVDALDVALGTHDNRQLLKEETTFEGLSSMTPLVLVDVRGEELGRCNIESRVAFEPGHSVDLGPLGYFSILHVRARDPIVLVAEPAARKQWPYELAVREDGLEQRRAFMDECPWSVGDRVKWPPERGEDPVVHQVVALRSTAGDGRSVIIIERVA